MPTIFLRVGRYWTFFSGGQNPCQMKKMLTLYKEHILQKLYIVYIFSDLCCQFFFPKIEKKVLGSGGIGLESVEWQETYNSFFLALGKKKLCVSFNMPKFYFRVSRDFPPGERRISEISPPLLSGSELYKNLSFSRPKSIFCLLEPLLSPFTKLFPPFFTASFFLCSLYRVKAQPMDSLLVCFAKHIMHCIVIVKVT